MYINFLGEVLWFCLDEESSLGVGAKKWKLVEINIVLGQSVVFLG